MKITPCFISVKYQNSIDREVGNNNVELKVDNIKILPKEKYKKETLLDLNNGIITRMHYQVIDEVSRNRETYELAFQISDGNESSEDYRIVKRQIGIEKKTIEFKYNKEEKIFYIPKIYRYEKSENIYKLGSNGDFEYKTSGRYVIDIYLNNERVKEIPVLVMPSSMSYKDYIKMLEDISGIREDILINEKSNIGMFKKWETKIDLIERCIKDISKPLDYINRSPHISLINEVVKLPYDRIKKFSERIILEKSMYPNKEKFLTMISKESSCIDEHTVIKSSLIDIREKLNGYIKSYKSDILDEQIHMKKIESTIEYIAKKSLSEKKKELKSKLEKTYQKVIEEEKNINAQRRRGDTDIIFSFMKGIDVNCCNINLTIEENIIIDIETTWDKEDRAWGLDLNYGSYKYRSLIDYKQKTGHFKGKALKIRYVGKNIHEVMFLVNFISNVKKNEFLEVEACIYRNREVTDDILGGTFKGNYGMRETRDFIIQIEEIKSINGQIPKVYSEKEVKGFLEPYILLGEEDTLGFIESIEEKSREFKSLEEKSYEGLLKKIDKLLEKGILAQAPYRKGGLKPTQIFNNDINYRRIYKNLNLLNKKIEFEHKYSKDTILVKSTCDIYEIWCLYKLVDILKNELGFVIINKDEVLRDLSNIMNIKNNKLGRRLCIKLKKKMSDEKTSDLEEDCISVCITYEEKIYLDEKNYKKPDYKLVICYRNIEKIFYLDAKYRNYTEQGRKQFGKDIIEVSIEKYIVSFGDSVNMPQNSMIIHSHKNTKYNYFGGDAGHLEDMNQAYMRNFNEKLKSHAYGGFYAIPSDITYIRVYFRLLFEYHFKKYEICWSCGEIYEIDIVEKKTKGGNDKYHYKCKSCNEFWVKNHCRKNISHIILKHLKNYHLEGKKGYPWFLRCPECDGIEKENSFHSKL